MAAALSSAASQKLTPLREQRDAEIGAQHEERAVHQVGDAHQPEDQREARRQQEQQAAQRNAVHRQRQPQVHVERLAVLALVAVERS